MLDSLRRLWRRARRPLPPADGPGRGVARWLGVRRFALEGLLREAWRALEEDDLVTARRCERELAARFPGQPETERLGRALAAAARTRGEELLTAAARADRPDAWRRWGELAALFPELRQEAAARRLLEAREQKVTAALDAHVARGRLPAARRLLAAVPFPALTPRLRRLAAGLEAWETARRLAGAGYFREAEPFFAAARTLLPRSGALRQEAADAAADAAREEAALGAFMEPSAARGGEERDLPGARLAALRAAAANRRREEDTALAAAREALHHGRTVAARRLLAPLLAGGNPAAAALWREADARDRKAAAALARALVEGTVPPRELLPVDHPLLAGTGSSPPQADEAAPRWRLRVDEGPEVWLLPGEVVDVGHARRRENRLAFLAPLASRHARLRREFSFHGGFRHVVEAVGEAAVAVNGEPTTRAELRDGDLLTLGPEVALRYRRPVDISAAAVLLVERGHGVDGVRRAVLVKPGRDGRVVLGAGPEAHVPVRSLTAPLFLYYQDGHFRLEEDVPAAAADRPLPAGAPLPAGVLIQAGGAVFTLEAG